VHDAQSDLYFRARRGKQVFCFALYVRRRINLERNRNGKRPGKRVPGRGIRESALPGFSRAAVRTERDFCSALYARGRGNFERNRNGKRPGKRVPGRGIRESALPGFSRAARYNLVVL
jgi:hypothetical protein